MSKKRKHDVLVLNKSWAPVYIIDWKHAMSVIYQEKVHCLDHEMRSYRYADWLDLSLRNAEDYYKVKSASVTIAIPEIIVSVTFNHLPSRCVKYSRQNVFTRDGCKCGYCGKQFKLKELTVDHIIPRAQGGMTTWDNVIACCFNCNQSKADRTPQQAGLKLKYKPHKPAWETPLDNINTEKHPCKSWNHFMKRVAVK